MSARLFRLPRPEAGLEHDVFWEVHHHCDIGNALRAEMGNDVDLVIFPVGLAGWEMPLDTAFEVVTVEPCGACGALLKAWFIWTGPKFFIHSAVPGIEQQ